MNSKSPYRNHSPHGWWIASYVEMAVWDDDPNPTPNSRHLAWENTIILKASDRDEAYEKAIRLGSGNDSRFRDDVRNRTGHWIFLGLSSLLPIYDRLEDGAEILWTEYGNRTVKKIRSLVKQKCELEVFDDMPAEGNRSD